MWVRGRERPLLFISQRIINQSISRSASRQILFHVLKAVGQPVSNQLVGRSVSKPVSRSLSRPRQDAHLQVLNYVPGACVFDVIGAQVNHLKRSFVLHKRENSFHLDHPPRSPSCPIPKLSTRYNHLLNMSASLSVGSLVSVQFLCISLYLCLAHFSRSCSVSSLVSQIFLWFCHLHISQPIAPLLGRELREFALRTIVAFVEEQVMTTGELKRVVVGNAAQQGTVQICSEWVGAIFTLLLPLR